VLILMRSPDAAHWIVGALLALFVATSSGGFALAADIPPCAQFTREGPPQPIARGDRRGLERLERINQAVNNTPYSVLFLGDSLTEGWDSVLWEGSLAPPHSANPGAAFRANGLKPRQAKAFSGTTIPHRVNADRCANQKGKRPRSAYCETAVPEV
jgi:hypothetical protein